MFAGLQGWQLVIILVLVVLLFAAPKLPSMARNLGQSMRIFSSEVKEMRNDGKNQRDGHGTAGTGAHAADVPAAGDPVEGRVVDPDRPRDDR